MRSIRKKEAETEKKPKDMTMEEFRAWCEANAERDERDLRENWAHSIAGIVRLYGSEPDGENIEDYKDCFSEEEYAELLALKVKAAEEENGNVDSEAENVVEHDEDTVPENVDEETDGVEEPEEPVDFTGKTAEELARHVVDKGLRVRELEALEKALMADMERMNAEHQEQIKTDWLKFKVHAVDCEFSTDITEANSYDGRFYTRIKCETDARSMLRHVYNEAADMMSADRLRAAAFEEISDFAENRFKVEVLKARKELSESQVKELERTLDIKEFREEVEQKLRGIRVPQLKAFHEYFKLVEYESVNGDFEDADFGEAIIGFFNRVTKSWNYSAYDAYHEIQDDFIKATEKYAEMATKVAISALKKRVEWREEIKLAS